MILKHGCRVTWPFVVLDMVLYAQGIPFMSLMILLYFVSTQSDNMCIDGNKYAFNEAKSVTVAEYVVLFVPQNRL